MPIRLNAAAVKLLQQLHRETGKTYSQIVSDRLGGYELWCIDMTALVDCQDIAEARGAAIKRHRSPNHPEPQKVILV
jgi:hypothetical protein